MNLSIRDKARPEPLVASNIVDRLYVKTDTGEIWISTAYGTLTVGVVGGAQYQISDRQLVNIDKKIGILGD